MNTTLTLAAVLAALCALPAVAADVDVTVQTGACATTPIESPPYLEPRVVVDDCGVSVSANSPAASCIEVGPFVWLHPYVHLASDCSLTVRY